MLARSEYPIKVLSLIEKLIIMEIGPSPCQKLVWKIGPESGCGLCHDGVGHTRTSELSEASRGEVRRPRPPSATRFPSPSQEAVSLFVYVCACVHSLSLVIILAQRTQSMHAPSSIDSWTSVDETCAPLLETDDEEMRRLRNSHRTFMTAYREQNHPESPGNGNLVIVRYLSRRSSEWFAYLTFLQTSVCGTVP